MVHSKKNRSGTRKKKPSDVKTKEPAVEPEKQQKLTKEKSPDVDQSFDKVFGEVEDYAIFILDPQGAILTWNKGAEKIKGYSAKEIIGKNNRIFYTKEDKENDLSEKLLSSCG